MTGVVVRYGDHIYRATTKVGMTLRAELNASVRQCDEVDGSRRSARTR
jgi:hypothetical protein